MKKVLNAGCGFISMLDNPYAEEHFAKDYEITTLDMNKQAKPDILNDITSMVDVVNDSFDAVYSQHVLEHLYTREVEIALNEFHRVLKKGGYVALYLPDFRKIVDAVIKGIDLEKVLYTTNAGNIRLIDMIFGYEKAIEAGNPLMTHKTCFTDKSIKDKLKKVGFVKVKLIHDEWDFFVTAYKIG